ncbi:MAG: hypothetical protein ABI155_11905 [Paralcaligenes sp.]
MDFTLSAAGETYRKRIKEFVDKKLIPLEKDPTSFGEHENINETLLQALKGKARQQGFGACRCRVNVAARAFKWPIWRLATRK